MAVVEGVGGRKKRMGKVGDFVVMMDGPKLKGQKIIFKSFSNDHVQYSATNSFSMGMMMGLINTCLSLLDCLFR